MIALIGVFILALLAMGIVLKVQQARLVHYVLLCGLWGAAIAGYVYWGSYPAFMAAKSLQASQQLIDSRRAQEGVASLRSLEAQLPLAPADIWRYLGEIYLEAGHADWAAAAFDKAVRAASSPQAAIGDRLALANAYFVRDQGQIGEAIDAQLQQILEADPKNPAALNLRAIGAFERGFYSAAIEDWRALRREIPDWSLQTHILQAIAKAQALHNTQLPPAAQIPVIELQIHIAPALAALRSEKSVVFVSMHIPELPHMPWAAVKEPIENLPLLVRFSDDLALQPTYHLQRGQQVVVKARFSPEGDAVGAAPEWVSLPQILYITGTNQSLSLTIDRRSISDGQ